MSSSSLALVQAYITALSERDLAALSKTLHPEASLRVYPEHIGAPECNGREAIIGLMRAAYAVIPSGKLEIVDTCVEGTKVWARISTTATLADGYKYTSTYVYMVNLGENTNGESKILDIAEMVDAVAGKRIMTLLHP